VAKVTSAEDYGRHNPAHASLPVRDVLRRVAERRVDRSVVWPTREEFLPEPAPDDSPTTELPVPGPAGDPDDLDAPTRPLAGIQEAHQWMASDEPLWWPESLAS
jgi:hypothetical protein